MFRLHGATAAAASGLFALYATAPAHAQTQCGHTYTIRPGDTLHEIAQQCRMQVAQLLEANPQIENPNSISAGARIGLDAQDSTRPDDSSYVVTQGDTLSAIAQNGGVNLRALLDANPGIEPRRLAIGQVITVPVDHPMLQVHLTPRSGSAGDEVQVEGEGFRPSSTVRIGAGPPESEWRELEDVRVDGDGQIDARIIIPEWAAGHDQIVLVAAGNRGREVRTRFDMETDRVSKRIEVRGKVTAGVECPILTADDGEVYSLNASSEIPLETGVRAHVEGREADLSFCQQGTPIEVGLFEILEPDTARLDREDVLGAWTQRGGDCGKPDFDIIGNAAGGQVIETSVGGEPRTGYVRLGDDPAFIFDRPRRELPLEPRRANGLSVQPPVSGPLTLGGVEIEDDGVVFIRCASQFSP